jgi:hypothetical protein
MSREDQYAISVKIGDLPASIWDKLDGGEVDSEELKYRPGGMLPQVSLGGSTEVGNLTVSRLYDLDRDHPGMHTLMASVGKATVVISRQPLDVDGNVKGDPLVYTGKLKAVTPPNVDSESSDAGMLEIEVTPSGTVA